MILALTRASKLVRCFACEQAERREVFHVVAVIDGTASRFAACLTHALAEIAPVVSRDELRRAA